MYNMMLTRKFVCKCNFTKDEWSLFDVPKSDFAAKTLNSALEQSIMAHSEPDEVRREMEGVMTMFADCGASDSEPYHLLTSVLRYVYGSYDA